MTLGRKVAACTGLRNVNKSCDQSSTVKHTDESRQAGNDEASTAAQSVGRHEFIIV